MKLVDLTGQSFFMWTVLSRAENGPRGTARWNCMCGCGVEKTIYSSSLIGGKTHSCGCLKTQLCLKNEVGQTYGRWTVKSKAPVQNRGAYWNCVCECGTEKVVSGLSLRNGTSRSCGCLDVELKKQRRGEKCPRWRGGVTPLYHQIRSCSKSVFWRTAVFERDNYTCVICGDDRGGNLNADHVKQFAQILEENNISSLEEALACSELWDIGNGRTLCKPCHRQTPTYSNRKFKLSEAQPTRSQ